MHLTSSIIVFVRGCFWGVSLWQRGQRFTQTHSARYERWRACKAIWLWHLYTGWMHHIAEHCNQVLQDLKIGLVCAF